MCTLYNINIAAMPQKGYKSERERGIKYVTNITNLQKNNSRRFYILNGEVALYAAKDPCSAICSELIL